MFDDLRNEGETSAFFQQEEGDPLLDGAPKKRAGRGNARSNAHFLGMTAFQRFFISVMIMLLVCVMGVMFLMVTGTIKVPF